MWRVQSLSSRNETRPSRPLHSKRPQARLLGNPIESMTKPSIKTIVKAKDEAPSALDNSKDLLTAAMKDAKTEHHNETKKRDWRVSTGSLLLDVATGGIRPSLTRLCGVNNGGKTPQMLEIVRNILKDVPKSKALWVIAEGRGLSAENMARCGLKFVTKAEDWEPGTVFVLYTNIFELVIKVIKDLVKDNPNDNVYAFVIDSVDGLMLRDDALKEITESNRVAGVPMLAKKMLQSLSLGMFTYGHWMGLISQVTAEIKLDPYSKAPNRGGMFSGGNSLLHGSDVIIQYEPSYPGDFILDGAGKMNDGKTKPIGQNVKVTLVKSMIETSRKTTVVYPIRYGRKPSGIWVEREIADMVLAWGLATRTGAWIAFTPAIRAELKDKGIEIPEKVQGLDNLYALFEENRAATEYLFGKFGEMLSAAPSK